MGEWISSILLKHHKQLWKYSSIGAICFVLDLGILLLITKYTIIHYLLASSIGYLSGSIVNYGLSINWVFKKRNLKGYWKTEFIFFLCIEILALLAMSSFLFAFKGLLKLNLVTAKILANTTAAFLNYGLKYNYLFSHHPGLLKLIKEHID